MSRLAAALVVVVVVVVVVIAWLDRLRVQPRRSFSRISSAVAVHDDDTKTNDDKEEEAGEAEEAEEEDAEEEEACIMIHMGVVKRWDRSHWCCYCG